MIINRNRIISDMLQSYNNDEILRLRLFVRFEGEDAEDLSGVTKDLFSSFWREVKKMYMKGDRCFNFLISPENILNESELISFGRILLHGYKLTGFLPTFINQAQLYLITTKNNPSEGLLTDSFLSTLSHQDSALLSGALEKDFFDDQLKGKIMDIMSSYEIRGLPRPSNLKNRMSC